MNVRLQRFGALFLAIIFLIGGTLPASAYRRGRTIRPKITKGAPTLAFVGSISAVDATGRTITVSGSSNETKAKNAPSGTVTFQVDPLCYIKAADGSSSTFASLQSGQSVSIVYSAMSAGSETHYTAKSIDLGTKAKPATSTTKKKH